LKFNRRRFGGGPLWLCGPLGIANMKLTTSPKTKLDVDTKSLAEDVGLHYSPIMLMQYLLGL